MRITRAASLAAALAAAGAAAAHPLAPAPIELRVLNDRVHLQVRVSDEQALNNAPASLRAPGGHGEYLRTHLRVLAGGRRLEGKLLSAHPPDYELEYAWSGPRPERLELWQEARAVVYLVRVAVDGQAPRQPALLRAGSPIDLGPEPGPAARAGAFVRQGIVHILTGYDHLLFVTALVLAATSFWNLVQVIGAFTAAHTLTLALATVGAVRVPAGVVEPLIAASIVFVAAQNVLWPERSHGRSRFLVAFFFGLFHGLGFAGGLREALEVLHGGGLALALLAFSVGVEIGHQTVVLPTFFALRLLRGARGEPGPWLVPVRRLASGAISLVGTFYLVAALRLN
ncbi:MAG TPA: HupE/UreJ family protein [Vicinamibacteria bacterium]